MREKDINFEEKLWKAADKLRKKVEVHEYKYVVLGLIFLRYLSFAFEEKKKDYLVIVDESHVSLPQYRGMYAGDRARKEVLIEYGFRLPSALDNRPLMLDEYINKAPHYLFVSATPTPINNTGLSPKISLTA